MSQFQDHHRLPRCDAKTISIALGGRSAGDREWMAPCPAHEDRKPSLSIGESDDGKVLVHCHAGCNQSAVIDELRSRGLWHEVREKAKRTIKSCRAEATRKRAEGERQQHVAAAAKAETIWKEATPTPVTHFYLVRKGIAPHGTCVANDGRLLVPMRDADGKLWNLERITPEKPMDGGADKKGLYQGRRHGCFFTFGRIGEDPVLCICEGFATGASLHEATGFPVAAAFNAGNLKDVRRLSARCLQVATDNHRDEAHRRDSQRDALWAREDGRQILYPGSGVLRTSCHSAADARRVAVLGMRNGTSQSPFRRELPPLVFDPPPGHPTSPQRPSRRRSGVSVNQPLRSMAAGFR